MRLKSVMVHSRNGFMSYFLDISPEDVHFRQFFLALAADDQGNAGLARTSYANALRNHWCSILHHCVSKTREGELHDPYRRSKSPNDTVSIYLESRLP